MANETTPGSDVDIQLTPAESELIGLFRQLRSAGGAPSGALSAQMEQRFRNVLGELGYSNLKNILNSGPSSGWGGRNP